MRFRYSLRTFLVCVAMTATMVAVWLNRASRQKAAVEKLLASGAWVYFDDAAVPMKIDDSGMFLHLFSSVKLITLRPTVEDCADDQLEIVADLPSLKQLTIWPGQTGTTLDLRAPGGLTDLGVRTITDRLTHLEHLGVTAADCSDESLTELKNRLQQTRYIHVTMRDPKREQLFVERQ